MRFGWWGAEELGLIGSTKYVQSLTFEQQLDIALYLDFDMIGSPNVGYFVYDGDDSDGVGAGAGPYGSAQIEKAFVDHLTVEKAVPTEGTDFTGRSDYGEFINQGIPAGGLFTGAEVLKTEAQAAKWGGTAGIAYEPNYHGAGDNLGNVDRTALDRNSDAIAWVTASYAISTEDVNGVPARSERAQARAATSAPSTWKTTTTHTPTWRNHFSTGAGLLVQGTAARSALRVAREPQGGTRQGAGSRRGPVAGRRLDVHPAQRQTA